MKALVSAIVVSLIVSGSALAADLPAKAPAAYDWSGLYVGGHVGGGLERTTFSDPSAGPVITTCCFLGPIGGGGGTVPPTDAHGISFLGGMQGGWMYQIGRLVVGGDFDFSLMNLNGHGVALYGPLNAGCGLALPCSAAETYGVSTKWMGTATTTIGIARDRWMLYSKVGAAWARQQYGLAVSGTGPALTGAGSIIPISFGFSPGTVRDTLVGWTIGTGVKRAITNEWFLNVEYNYIDFGTKGQSFTAVCTAAPTAFGPCLAGGTFGTLQPSNFTPTFNSHISEVKIGVNYKFPSGFLFW